MVAIIIISFPGEVGFFTEVLHIIENDFQFKWNIMNEFMRGNNS